MPRSKKDPAAGARIELLVAAIDFGADEKATRNGKGRTYKDKTHATLLQSAIMTLLKAARKYYQKSLPGLRTALRTATRPRRGDPLKKKAKSKGGR